MLDDRNAWASPSFAVKRSSLLYPDPADFPSRQRHPGALYRPETLWLWQRLCRRTPALLGLTT